MKKLLLPLLCLPGRKGRCLRVIIASLRLFLGFLIPENSCVYFFHPHKRFSQPLNVLKIQFPPYIKTIRAIRAIRAICAIREHKKMSGERKSAARRPTLVASHKGFSPPFMFFFQLAQHRLCDHKLNIPGTPFLHALQSFMTMLKKRSSEACKS